MDAATSFAAAGAGGGAGAAGGAGADIAPSQTLYINNLNEKVKKSPMKKNLYTVFSQFGRVVDIVVCKTLKLRGQAWVVFSDAGAATSAMKAMQGFPFYDKPMRIQFAKEKSHAVEKLEGAYKPRAKRPREDGAGGPPKSKAAKLAEAAAPAAPAAAPAAAAAAPFAPPMPAYTLPNRTLLVQNLPAGQPAEVLEGMLRALFGSYAGLVGVRPVPARQLAFVDFDAEASAMPALQGLHNFKISADATLSVTYAAR